MYKSGPLSNLASPVAVSPVSIASIPLGSIFLAQPNATLATNTDGSTGVTATQFATFQTWVTFPADDVYTFNVRAFPTLAATLLRANMIQVWVDQIPIPADNQPANLNWSRFATAPIGGPATDYIFRTPVFAGTHVVTVALCTAQNAQLNPNDNSQPQGVHVDRLIVSSTAQGIPAEPAGNRDPYLQPGSSLHFFRTSFGGGAQWGNVAQTISSGTYNTATGVITLTMASPSPFVANQVNGVALTGLTGTGTNLANLNGRWPCLTSSGSTVTLQGRANQGTVTITGGTALDADVNIIQTAANVINVSIGNFSVPFYQGQVTDLVGTWILQSQFSEQNLQQGQDPISLRLPVGVTPAGGTDGAIIVADVNNKRYFYVGSDPGTVIGTAPGPFTVQVGIGGITDSYQLNHASHQSNTCGSLGSIHLDDINQSAINHTLLCAFNYSMVNNNVSSQTTDVGWPTVGSDYISSVYPYQGEVITSGTYTTATGVIVLTMALNPTKWAAVTSPTTPVILRGLLGTGSVNLLNDQYGITAVSTTQLTLQGPTGLGTVTITGGTVNYPNAWCQWGSLIGIPASTAKPGGLNTGASMLWDAAQRYGLLMNNQAGNYAQQVVTLYGDPALNGNATMTQIQGALGTVLAACNVIRNNLPTSIKGGGIPNVATQSGLVSRGMYPILPFTLTPSPATPFQVAVTGYNLTTGQQLTTIAAVPAGSLIFLAITPQGAGTTVTSITDSVNNTYILCASAPITAPNSNGQDIWACVNTATLLPLGSKITINLSAGQCNANAYASLTASGGLDQHAQAVSTAPVTSFSLSAGTTTTANQLVVAAANSPVAGGRFLSNQNRINSLNTPVLYDTSGSPFNAETYLLISTSQNPVYNPFWSPNNPSPYAAAVATFSIGPLPVVNTATRVQTFINSLGVVTHYDFFPAYQNAPINTMLQFLGVFNVRDNWPNSANPGFSQYASTAAVGAKFCFNGFPAGPGTPASVLASEFAPINTLLGSFPGCVGLIEGPNEVNNFPVSYGITAVATGASGSTITIPTPASIQKIAQAGYGNGLVVTDTTNPGAIPANTTLLSATPTSVTLSAATSVVNGDTISFIANVSGQNFASPQFTAGAIGWQTDIYNFSHANSATSTVPVAYFTDFTGGTEASWFVSGISDKYNEHPYSNFGNQPIWNIQAASAAPPQRPEVATETGYTTANTPSTQNASCVDQATQAIYTLYTYLDAWNAGFQQCYIYELIDEDFNLTAPTNIGDYFGLFNPQFSGYTAKPAATAIHNLTTILADPNATALTFTPGALNYTVSGLLPQTTLPNTTNGGGYSLLFQKANGAFDIVVWQEFQVWNEGTRSQNTITPISVTVNFGATFANVSVYDPIAGTTAINTFTNVSSIVLSLGSHPLIVEVTNRPTVTSVSPNTGSTSGATPVTITGANFTGATSVFFGGTAAASFTVNSSTQITATTPAHVAVAGGVSVVVTTPSGFNDNNTAYTYGPPPIVTSVSPSSGPQTGNTSVTINGSGFTGAQSITFNGAPATGFGSLITDTSIGCFTPAGNVGAASVVVTTAFGFNAPNSAYTYTGSGGGPVVSTVVDTGTSTPNGSTGGNRPVTITGSGFTGATSVTFGGVAATIVSVASGTITCRTPPHVAGLVSVAVTTPSGTGSASVYTYRIVDGSGAALSAPSVASAQGFNTLSFQEEWNDLLSVQVNATAFSGSIPAVVTGYVTPTPGYNFYTQSFGWANTKYNGSFDDWYDGTTVFPHQDGPSFQFYSGPTTTSQYYSVSGSVLTMVGHTTGADTLAEFSSAAYGAANNNAQGYVGNVINPANGFYIEVRVAGPGSNIGGATNSVWMTDIGKPSGTNTTTATEIDFSEWNGPSNFNQNLLQYNSNTPANSSLLNGPTQVATPSPSGFHVFGCLWVPGGGGTGTLTYYTDGAITRGPLALPNGAIGVGLATQRMILFVQTDSNTNGSPYQVDYIRVWQLTPTG